MAGLIQLVRQKAWEWGDGALLRRLNALRCFAPLNFRLPTSDFRLRVERRRCDECRLRRAPALRCWVSHGPPPGSACTSTAQPSMAFRHHARSTTSLRHRVGDPWSSGRSCRSIETSSTPRTAGGTAIVAGMSGPGPMIPYQLWARRASERIGFVALSAPRVLGDPAPTTSLSHAPHDPLRCGCRHRACSLRRRGSCAPCRVPVRGGARSPCSTGPPRPGAGPSVRAR